MVQILPQKTNIGSQIGQALAGGFQSGISDYLRDRYQQEQMKLSDRLRSEREQAQSREQGIADEQNFNTISEAFGPEFANVWKSAPVGGKTELLRAGLDAKLRGLDIKEMLGQMPGQMQQQSQQSAFPQLPTEKGLKPSDIVKREESREKTNIPFYNEAKARLRGFDKEEMSLSRLAQLNRSGKLPEGLGRINVNPKSGELLLPFLATPEAQLAVKTINDFTTKAKDSYGGRVTNFELDRFMARLPTLLNSPEGREAILEQMQIINQLDKLEEKSIIDVYDHYGVGRINAQEASKIASQMRHDQEEQLKERYNNLENLTSSISDRMPSQKGVQAPSQMFDKLPSAVDHKGKRIRDTETGQIFESTGKTWRKVS